MVNSPDDKKKMLVGLILVVTLLAPSTVFLDVNKDQVKPMDVLIIFSTGIPYNWKVIKDIARGINKEFKDIDAVTTPTPLTENCESIAIQLASVLRDKDLTVRIAETEEIEHRDEILRTRMVVVGSPAYFGNVSWKIKKLFDVQFHKIYLLEKGRLSNRRIAAFSMAEVRPSARGALEAIKSVVDDCNGRFGPTMIVLTEDSEKEVKMRINKFAEQIAILLKRNF